MTGTRPQGNDGAESHQRAARSAAIGPKESGTTGGPETEAGSMDNDHPARRNAIFCCFGCMSSVGTLTGVAMLEAYRRLDTESNGLFCTSAIAAGIPKHRRITELADRIIAIDGCANGYARRILERDGLKVGVYLNLVVDLHIPKVGPFRPFDYSKEDLERAVDGIVRLCEGTEPRERGVPREGAGRQVEGVDLPRGKGHKEGVGPR